jgi:hypothetical protein
MRVEQDMAVQRQLVVPGAIRNELERVVTEKLTRPPFEQMQAAQNALLLQVMELQRRISEQAFAPSNAAPSLAKGAAFESQSPAPAPQALGYPPQQYNTNFESAGAGVTRKKASKTDIVVALSNGNGLLWSKDLKKARQYWIKFQYGLNMRPSLRCREVAGSDWRSDNQIQTASGRRCGALRKDWGERVQIYNWIIHRVEDSDVDEEVVIGEVQAVFDQNMSSKNHPNLQAISTEL